VGERLHKVEDEKERVARSGGARSEECVEKEFPNVERRWKNMWKEGVLSPSFYKKMTRRTREGKVTRI